MNVCASVAFMGRGFGIRGLLVFFAQALAPMGGSFAFRGAWTKIDVDEEKAFARGTQQGSKDPSAGSVGTVRGMLQGKQAVESACQEGRRRSQSVIETAERPVT